MKILTTEQIDESFGEFVVTVGSLIGDSGDHDVATARLKESMPEMDAMLTSLAKANFLKMVSDGDPAKAAHFMGAYMAGYTAAMRAIDKENTPTAAQLEAQFQVS